MYVYNLSVVVYVCILLKCCCLRMHIT